MDAFAATCDAVASTSSRLEKVRLVGEYLAGLDDAQASVAAVFFSGMPFPKADPRTTSVGFALVTKAAVVVTGWDADTVKACARAAGELGEAVGLLIDPAAAGRGLGLLEARRLFDDLARARGTERRLELLVEGMRRTTPRGVKYLLKLALGDLRIGLLEKQVEEAIGAATGQSKALVHAANVRAGDLSAVMLAARAGRLEEVQANLFHPIDFMLASPIATAADVTDPTQFIVERKLDGIRAQAHVEAGRVVLFSRGMGDVTASFPELVPALGLLRGPSVLDGEVLAHDGTRAVPFLQLQRRLSRKAPDSTLQREVPVAFVAWDLLHDASGLLFDEPIETRRARLADLLKDAPPSVRLSPSYDASTADDLERLFAESREAGDEGLILKRRGSPYEAGKRGQTWLKLKRALGTLDVVITAAEQGHGQRASVLSDYTFAVRTPDGFANVGKAYSGLTDEEIRDLTLRLKRLTLETFGRVRIVKPEIVLEVAFDTVQKSSRHKSGYALRFPRIVRIRDDKFAHDADTLERVEELYRQALGSPRIVPAVREEPESPRSGDVTDLPLFSGYRDKDR